MQHRSDIDGLRALAVVPVILFHAGVSVFSGGFVGVDIFFVISGYLITGIIASAQEKGRFSLLGFYERRARRIMPVLIVVMLCCVPFAWAWMLPQQMIGFGKAVVAVCLFLSNVLFWQETGYFAASAELNPLLHTWSLAVEEQYYLFFPLLMMATARAGRYLRIAIVALLALASLGLAQYGSQAFPDATFYLPFSRAWELFAGALCALRLHGRGPVRNDALSALGLLMIVVSLFVYDASTPYPSLYTVLPVAGTALVILFTASGTIAFRILSLRAMVFIGLISYSAYLWHQPLFAFARIRSLDAPSPLLMASLTVLTFALAILSWRFVETPFRKGGWMRAASSARVVGTAGLAGAAMMIVGALLTLDNGLQFRLPAQALEAVAVAEQVSPVMEACLFDKGETGLAHPLRACLTPHSSSSRTILIGDSHAGAVAGEALRAFDAAGEDLYIMAHSACVGFSGFAISDPKYRLRCHRFFTGIEDYIRTSGMTTVIMLSRWELYVDGTAFDNGEGGVEALHPTYADLYENRDAMAAENDPARKTRVLDRYVSDIKAYLDLGIRVVLVYPIPEAGWNVPQRVAKAAIAGGTDLSFGTSYARYIERNGLVLAAFDAIDDPRLQRIKPASIFCNTMLPEQCVNSMGAGWIFYFDDDHLSSDGAALLVPEILRAVQAPPRRASPA